MKNKKGFTLVELIAVVVIVAVVIGIGVPVFINVRKNVLNNQFENIKTRIEAAAVKYANDTQIITVSVGKLIEEGYLTADDQKAIYNPVDNSSLNCKIVEVSLNDGTYTAKLTDNGELEDGTCSNYNATVASLIKITCYSETNDESELAKCEKTLKNTNNAWYSGSVKLSLDDKVTKNVSDYRWQGLTGESSNESEIIVTADSVKSTTFSLSLTYEDGTSETSSAVVQIDNQKPVIIDIVKDDNWAGSKKNVTINASDSSGSGIFGYYVGKNEACNGEYVTNNKFDLEVGKYYVCVKDNAGNVSDVSSFDIDKIDTTKPVAKATVNEYFVTDSETKGITYYSELSRKIVFEDAESGISAIKYCFTDGNTCTPDKNATIMVGNTAEAIISYPTSKKATRVCVKAIDNVNNESDVYCDSTFLVDTTKPVSVKAEHNQSNSSYVKVSASDPESGIYKYTCRYGTSSNNLNKSVDAVDGICDLGNLSSGITYYVVVDAYNNANLMTSSSAINFKAEVKMSDAYTEVCGNGEYCNSPLYIKYNNSLFVVYRNNNGYKAIYNGIYTDSYFRSYSCCNQGYCNYGGTNFVNGQIFSEALAPFLSSLSNYKNKLILTEWNTGVYSDVGSRKSTSYVGLLDYKEYENTQSKIWMYSSAVGKYFWLASPHSYSSGSYANVMAALYNGSTFTSSGFSINSSYGVRPVVVFKGDIVFTSGNGTLESPYVV